MSRAPGQPVTRLTESDVRRIRALAQNPALSAREIAAALRNAGGPALGAETVRRIMRRETWAWLPDEPGAGKFAEPSADELARSVEELQRKIAEVKEPARTAAGIIEELKGDKMP